jgi:hypothetical protein
VHTAGGVAVHQFCQIGSYSFIGGGSMVYLLFFFLLFFIIVFLFSTLQN